MKRVSIFLMAIILISCSGLKRSVLTERQLEELQTACEKKHYFDLRDVLQQYDGHSSVMLAYYRGVTDNKFNRLESSIKHLKTFIQYANAKKDADKLINCWETLGDDYSKLFRYKAAAETYHTILNQFEDRLGPERKRDLENYVRIYTALQDIPPQTAVIQADTEIKLIDEGYIPVRINNVDLRLGLDTGANYSFIMRTLAEKVSMRIIDVNVDVQNVAGQFVLADIGVAAEMKIGHAEIQNVIFFVFDDRDLYFEQADYQIIGALGFPAVCSLKEVTFFHMNALSIPMESHTSRFQNLCYDDLTPVISGFYQGKRYAFCLDTGAGRSVLYLPFYRAYKEQLKAQYPLRLNRQQGLGGFRDIPAHLMNNAVLSFAGKDAVFFDLPVLTDVTTDDSQYFYGNIGRDLLNQFDTMTMNFSSMFVQFE